jgi:eukaryotic-like serine/threonine-protein kinase
VSSGPQQREIPDVSGLTYDQAVQKLTAAGFKNFKPSSSASTPELKDRVLLTNPPANQTSAITNVITIVLGAGPQSKPVPDVKGTSPEDAQRILAANGFTAPPVVVQVDGLKNTAGQVVGTIPAANETAPVDAPISIQVSKGNQFTMPNLRGMFWDDAYPLLTSLGWQMGNNFTKLPNAQNSGVPSNGVVTQDPPPGTPTKVDGAITLSFAQ